MCGRFVSARQRQELIDEFLVERDQVVGDVAPDYNVAPTDPIYAVLGQCRELRLVRWGLVPSWAKDRSGGARLINARAETVAAKPSFRSAFARRRCLIPADGYYEWRPLGGREHGRPRKQPYYIHRADGQGMALAVITTQATDHMGWVHDRMPMVVSPVHWDEWLDPATGDADSLLKTITPAASDDLETRPVSTAVNSVANDGPDLITAITGITALAAGGESGDILAADSAPGEA
jgi:putative SOS response-associated peptidase YedK